MIVQCTQVIFTTLNSPKCPKRNVPGGKNCQTFWMVIFSIQFDLDVASGQKLEGNVTTLHKLGLRRGKRYWMMMMIIWKEKRSNWNWLNLGIMDARNVSSGVLPHTHHPGPRIVPSCHPGWGAVSDLGGSFAERGFKMGHRHSGTTTRAKTAPFQLSFHTLIFRCFVLIPSLCLWPLAQKLLQLWYPNIPMCLSLSNGNTHQIQVWIVDWIITTFIAQQ